MVKKLHVKLEKFNKTNFYKNLIKKISKKKEWMITDKEETFHLLDVNEELVKYVPVTVLNR